MGGILQAVNDLFAGVMPISDFLWDVPTNFNWYSSIPILGQYSLGIIFLLGIGIYFTIRLKGVQFKEFKESIRMLTHSKKEAKVGTTPLQAFLMSMGGRVGAGNIVGVTGAISIGGPGAIFWMWVSAVLGMSTAFAEGTLAQIYKERKGDEYVGGFTFYTQKLWRNKVWVGTAMCVLYLIYNLMSIPVHTFHVFTSMSTIMDTAHNRTTDVTEPVYYVVAVVIIVVIAIIAFGGIKKAVGFADAAVPTMALIYIAVAVLLMVANITKLPAFFVTIFTQAFKPQSIFGGTFGIALAQGLKRGLLSNEAGMGSATQAAAVSDQDHPCEQGIMQSIGVFIDTVVICTLTGFIVAGGAIWENPNIDWSSIKYNKMATFVASIRELTPGTALDSIVVIVVILAFGLFAFTTLCCDITYSEIAAHKVSDKKGVIKAVRVAGAFVFVPLGTLTVLSGLQLDNLWAVSDLVNIVLVFVNVPTLFIGRKIIIAAYKDYKAHKGERFVSARIGVKSDVWTEEEAKARAQE